MKKKIAGVLTTVLAASLLVGNHPVTVQVGQYDLWGHRMTRIHSLMKRKQKLQKPKKNSPKKPKQQRTRRTSRQLPRHRRKKKGRKRNTEKGSSREQLRQYFLRRKNTSQKAKKLAQQYDYTGAISVLKNNWKFATSDKMQEAAAAYMKKKEMPVWNIHLRISPMYFFIP